jgi:hypothetical protein
MIATETIVDHHEPVNTVSGNLQLKAVRKAAAALNVMMEIFEVGGPADFEPAFQAAAGRIAAAS